MNTSTFPNKRKMSGMQLRRCMSVDRAMVWKTGVRRHILTCLAVYTLLYLIAVNSIYIAGKSYETSINIKVRQISSKTNQHSKEAIRTAVAQSKKQRNQTFVNLSKHFSNQSMEIYKQDNISNERLSYKDENTEQDFDSKEVNIDQPELVDNGKKPFTYDHPVLRRIDGMTVFYISAISDIYSTSSSVSINQNSIMTSTTTFFLRPLLPLNETSHLGTVTINGWESHNHVKVRYNCCYRYDDKVLANDVLHNLANKRDKTKIKNIGQNENNVQENNEDRVMMVASRMTWKNVWNIHKLKIIKAAQFICPLVSLKTEKGENKYPTKVALSNKDNCANWKSLKYIGIDNQTTIKGESIAVCPKLVYGNYSAERLVEWFEFNKLMGVDKIMLFTYNVVKEVQIVLNHYVTEGLLITKEFDIPAKTSFKRKPGDKHMMAFQDEQVTVFDCIERFNRFKFIAVLDLDEFLIPADGKINWKTMLNNLKNEHRNASGFSFHTQIFTLDWGVSNSSGKLFVTKYTKRTSTMWDRKKNIIIPDRIQRGKVWTHAFASREGYEQVKIQTKVANIFHYRKCRRHWITSHTCMKGRPKYFDNTMVKTMQKIENNIIKLKSILLKK